MVTLTRIGRHWAVTTGDGTPAGTITPTTLPNGRRMWKATGLGAQRGVFPTRRTAAAWLTSHTGTRA